MWRVVVGGVAAVLVVGSAWATNCPNDMKVVDDALKASKADDATKKKITDLRKKGEDEHKAGKHADSLKSLAEAKKMLNVK